ncbi:MAG: redoxin domain-containing protein [Acidobacteriota bacterium]|nr:MAG: redoxin domain-containing protein [Acidobacteriota bacterium]
MTVRYPLALALLAVFAGTTALAQKPAAEAEPAKPAPQEAPAAPAATDANAEKIKRLEARLAELERRLATLERQSARAAGPSPEQEQAATGLLNQLQQDIQNGDYDAAKAKLAQLGKDYPGTRAQRQSARLSRELAVVGNPAPETLGVQTWFQGESDVKWDGQGTTLVVFWEEWCPHCRREVPKVEQTYQRLREQGLQVVGLTKLTRGVSEEKVRSFIETNKLSYPIAKENGQMSQALNVSGIPAAAVIKDGKVVWRGHPSRLTDEMLAGWL